MSLGKVGVLHPRPQTVKEQREKHWTTVIFFWKQYSLSSSEFCSPAWGHHPHSREKDDFSRHWSAVKTKFTTTGAAAMNHNFTPLGSSPPSSTKMEQFSTADCRISQVNTPRWFHSHSSKCFLHLTYGHLLSITSWEVCQENKFYPEP